MKPTIKKPVYPPKFNFKGWEDMDCGMPKKDGDYLCLIQWVDRQDYQYMVVPFTKGRGFQICMPTVQHCLWTHLPPMPF